jgi:hypothetical protein
MNANHLETLTEALASIRALHTRVAAVSNELQRAYGDQSGEWRCSTEGDAASKELGAFEAPKLRARRTAT